MFHLTDPTCQIDLRDVGEGVEAVVLHHGDVIVHEEELREAWTGVCQPGRGHGLRDKILTFLFHFY